MEPVLSPKQLRPYGRYTVWPQSGLPSFGAVLLEHNAEAQHPFPGDMKISQHFRLAMMAIGKQTVDILFVWVADWTSIARRDLKFQ
jgi:hypothetical protein